MGSIRANLLSCTLRITRDTAASGASASNCSNLSGRTSRGIRATERARSSRRTRAARRGAVAALESLGREAEVGGGELGTTGRQELAELIAANHQLVADRRSRLETLTCGARTN